MTSRRRFLAALGAAATGPALAGCGYYPGGGDIRWREESLGGLYRSDEVGVTGETLYTVSESVMSYDIDTETWVDGAEVVAYDTGNGRERFTEQFDRPASVAALGAGGAAVALGDEENPSQTVARFGPDGQSWETPVEGGVERLAVAEERVYAVTADGALAACADGSERWRVDLEPELGSDEGGFGPTVAASAETVVCWVGGSTVCFDPDGTRRWSRSTVNARRLSLVDGEVFAHAGHGLATLDSDTGETRWISGDNVASFAVTADAIYCRISLGVVAFDRSGTRQWTAGEGSDAGRNRGVDDSPDYFDRVAADDRGVFVESDSGLTALATDDGSRRWTVDYDRIDEGPFLVDEGVLVVSGQGATCHIP